MSYEIKFGTDGWRSVIADGFTFPNVRRVTQAACNVIRKTSKSRLVLIGYDRRFFSERFAETAAQVATANGMRVEMSTVPIGSPTLSFHAKKRKAAMGFMITASHNPSQFNGFKIKGAHGGSVDESITKLVEDQIDTSDIQTGDRFGKKADFIAAYLASLKKLVRIPNLKNIKGPVVFDAMHGPGGDLFGKLFGSSQSKLVIIRKEVDPLFGGVNPEPIEVNLDALKQQIATSKAAVGIAVDGDADRIGLIDDLGHYLPPHTVMPLLLLHLLETKKLKGKIVQTVSMGYLTERIANHFQMPFEQVPVGFKYIAKKMGEEKILLGGEESGGYGIGLWSPERDGLLCALLLLEMLAAKKEPLSVLVKDLEKRFGASHFKRVDFPVRDRFDKDKWVAYISANLPKAIGGINVKNVILLDGIKLVMDDDSWLLMRPSGTEPLMRTYSEGTTPKIVEQLLMEAERMANAAVPVPKKTAEEKRKMKKDKAAAAR